MSSYHRTAWLIMAGMGLGFFVIQPFAVLVYNLAPETRLTFAEIAFWKRLVEMSLGPTSIFMGLGFAVLGGVNGYFVASWITRQERLIDAEMESAKRLAAMETMRELMVTLAHYIRNANMVIGGFSLRLARNVADPHHKEQLQLVQQASRDIEAVIATLQNMTEISVTQYVNSGAAQMIDLQKDLENRLATTTLHLDSNNR